MKNFKIELKDNDYVVRAATDLDVNDGKNDFGKFFKDIDEELITGQTAHLEIESADMGLMKFEISKAE